MNAREILDEIEYRLASPMVTYKENATEDAPALVAALRAVRDLHRPVPVYVLADLCGDDSDAHADADHAEGGEEGGEWLCYANPTGEVWCGECRDVDGDRIPHPCPTVSAIEGALGGER